MNQNLVLLLTISLIFICIANEDNKTISSDGKRGQELALLEAELNCVRLNQTKLKKDKWCPMIWDGALCWPHTQFNKIAQQKCPDYVVGFNHNNMAYKTCTINGTWYFNEKTNSTWTDYTYCTLSGHDGFNNNLIPHIVNFGIIAKVGYSVSFGTLLIAFLILTFVKRLRCPRNNLHLQLFASFMIRSFMYLIKNIFVSTSTLQESVMSQTDQHSFAYYDQQSSNGSFANENPTISCKIFTTIWQYSLMANYNWILMEGIYLHNLIFFHIFNDNSSIFYYVIFGWGEPLLSIIPWATLRTLYENTLCWTTNKNSLIFWIFIRGPITVTIILNFVFFVRITTVLFMKMFSPSVVNYARQYRYRAWFKSTLVLVPLFGVHYMFLLVFNSFSSYMSSGIFEIIWLYIDLLFSSFQGCVVAVLYCFYNSEVQQEVRKLWQTWKSNRSSASLHSHHSNHSTTHQSYLTQSLTYLSRGRNSFLSTGDNNVYGINRKEASNNHSRSPSPSRNLSETTNTLISQTSGQKIQIEPNNVSQFLVISNKQNTTHNSNANILSQVDSSKESKM